MNIIYAVKVSRLSHNQKLDYLLKIRYIPQGSNQNVESLREFKFNSIYLLFLMGDNDRITK